MLFLCDLPTDVEPIDKEKSVKLGNNKIAMLIATMIGMLIIISIAAIMIAAKNKTPKNLFEEVSKGAYLDGEVLDKEEDPAEILAIYDTYETLSKEELIQEIEELKKELDEIKTAQLSTIAPVTEMQDEIQDKPQSESLNESQNAQQTEEREQAGKNEQTREKETSPLQEPKKDKKVESDNLLYVARPTKTIVIPTDIEKAATIKKSSLYK